MTRWLKRGFWLSAWSCWVWLGFGLHRELPREFKQTSGDLGLRGAERPVGFVGGGDLVLTETSLPNDRSRFVVWDAAGPSRRFECVTPLGWRTTRVAPSHAVAFGGPFDGVFRAMTVVEVLDLQTGGRRRLADEAEVVGVHPTRSWVALAIKGPRDVAEGRSFPCSNLWVVDFRTGSRIFEWSDSQTNADGPRILDCQFDGDDGIFVFADHYFGNEPEPVFWEVIRLSLTSGETSRMALAAR